MWIRIFAEGESDGIIYGKVFEISSLVSESADDLTAYRVNSRNSTDKLSELTEGFSKVAIIILICKSKLHFDKLVASSYTL